MDLLFDACLRSILLHDLLNTPRRVRPEPAALKQVTVFGVRLEMTRQDQPEAGREKDVAVFRSFALFDENSAPSEVHVPYLDVDQLTYADRRKEEEPQHYLVLNVSAFLDCPKESLQIRLAQQLRKLPMALWPTQAELSPCLLADVQEPVVIEVFLAGHRYESRYNFRFRILACGYEIIAVFGGV